MHFHVKGVWAGEQIEVTWRDGILDAPPLLAEYLQGVAEIDTAGFPVSIQFDGDVEPWLKDPFKLLALLSGEFAGPPMLQHAKVLDVDFPSVPDGAYG